MSNLKRAPLPLTGELVAKLVGDRPAYGKGLTYLLIRKAAADGARLKKDSDQ